MGLEATGDGGEFEIYGKKYPVKSFSFDPPPDEPMTVGEGFSDKFRDVPIVSGTFRGKLEHGIVTPVERLLRRMRQDDRLSAVARRFIPPDMIGLIDRTVGACDFYLCVFGDWLGGNADQVIIYREGSTQFRDLMGKSRAECREWAGLGDE